MAVVLAGCNWEGSYTINARSSELFCCSGLRGVNVGINSEFGSTDSDSYTAGLMVSNENGYDCDGFPSPYNTLLDVSFDDNYDHMVNEVLSSPYKNQIYTAVAWLECTNAVESCEISVNWLYLNDSSVSDHIGTTGKAQKS